MATLKVKTFFGYEYNLSGALKRARAYGTPASMRTILRLWNQGLIPRSGYYTANSEHLIGRDVEGRFGNKDSPVAIITQGARVLTPHRLEPIYKKGFLRDFSRTLTGATRLTSEEISNVLSGENVYSIDDVMKDKITKAPRAIVMPRGAAARSETGIWDVSDLLRNKVFVANCGSLRDAEAHVKVLDSLRKGDYFVWHRFDDSPSPQGRFAYLDQKGMGVIKYLTPLRYDGRFVVLHKGA